jgi:hypothetical protein
VSMNWKDLIDEAGGIDFTPVPAGTYNVVADKAEATTASTGKPMVKVVFKIEDGPQAGRLIYNNFVVSSDNPNALKFFFKHMAVFGMSTEFFDMNPSMGQVAGQVQGKRCQVMLDPPREYGGSMQNGNVKAVMPPLGGSGGGIGLNVGAPVPMSGPAIPAAPVVAPVQEAPTAARFEPTPEMDELGKNLARQDAVPAPPKSPLDDSEEPF